MLNGEPLRDNASIRDFRGGDGCHLASALEEALLLPKDMAELRSIRRHEVFLNFKRYLGMVCTYPPFLFCFYIFMVICKVTNPFLSSCPSCFRVEEITNSGYRQLDDERNRRMAAVESFNIANKSNKDLRKKLKEEEQGWRSTDSALKGAQKQAEDQRLLLRDAKEQLASSKEQIASLRKQLEEVQKLKD